MTCSTSWAPATPFIHLSQLVQGSWTSCDRASYCSSNCRNSSCWFWYMLSTSPAQSAGHGHVSIRTGPRFFYTTWLAGIVCMVSLGTPGTSIHYRKKGSWQRQCDALGELWVLPSTAPFPLLTTQINSPWLATIQINGFSITINYHLMCMVVVIATHVPWYN